MGPLNLGSLFLHRCVQLLFVILEINNPCGSESFRMAAVLHILGKRLLLFWINSQLSWRRCIRSVPFTFSAAAAKLLQPCPTLCDPIDGQPSRLPHPWDFPGKNTGVGCHFLLQCMKVKGESEVAQSCSTLSNPMDCSLPGSSIYGIFQARVLEWGAIAFS